MIEKLINTSRFDTDDTVALLVGAVNEIIDDLNSQKTHDHKCCKDNRKEGAVCCLCHPHEGCELGEPSDYMFQYNSETESWKSNVPEGAWKDAPAEPAGWEERFDFLGRKNEFNPDKSKLPREIKAFIRQVELEAVLKGYEEGLREAVPHRSGIDAQIKQIVENKRALLEMRWKGDIQRVA